MSSQVAVRIPDELAQALQQLVDDGTFPTMADAIRTGVRRLVQQERDRALDDAISAGYRRQPPTEIEESWAARSSRELIAEEPW